MRIQNISNVYDRPINDLEIGECFMYNDSLHMKVDIGSLECEDVFSFPNIAVDLEDNSLIAIADSVKVRKIGAKIVVD